MNIAGKHLNFEYRFERRRYGRAQFYTWLNYRIIDDPESAWQPFGDPWPKPRLNKIELAKALDEIALRTIKPGSIVTTVLGTAEITGVSTLQPGCFMAKMENMEGRELSLGVSNIICVHARIA